MADTSVEFSISQLKAARTIWGITFIYNFSWYLIFSPTFGHCQIEDTDPVWLLLGSCAFLQMCHITQGPQSICGVA